MKKLAVVAVSGGIDSAVTCYILKQQGYLVTAVHAVCYDKDVPFCTSQKDREDAIRIASYLNIPIKIIDLTSQYEELVINKMVKEYKNGLTPNPDVFCNKYIKFDLIFNYCKENFKFDYFATGHYARISQNGLLQSPLDYSKDQTYFLWDIDREIIKSLKFPLGGLLKSDVRELAEKIDLPNKNKADSQGLCFIGNVKIQEFLMQYLPQKTGDVVNIAGEIIGQHKGHYFYTIGQRHGFSVNEYYKNPLYILDKIPFSNKLIASDREKLYKNNITVNLHLNLLDNNIECFARIRNLGEKFKVDILVENVENSIYSFTITNADSKFYAPAKGQSCVIYNADDEVIGGGYIV